MALVVGYICTSHNIKIIKKILVNVDSTFLWRRAGLFLSSYLQFSPGVIGVERPDNYYELTGETSGYRWRH